MSCYFCNTDDTISHLLFECAYAKNVWRIVKHVFFNNHEITHDMVIFGKGLSIALNYIFSIYVYYIYKEFIICSFQNRLRREFCISSFRYYLTIRTNVYQQCKSDVWHDVCTLLDTLLNYLET